MKGTMYHCGEGPCLYFVRFQFFAASCVVDDLPVVQFASRPLCRACGLLLAPVADCSVLGVGLQPHGVERPWNPFGGRPKRPVGSMGKFASSILIKLTRICSGIAGHRVVV